MPMAQRVIECSSPPAARMVMPSADVQQLAVSRMSACVYVDDRAGQVSFSCTASSTSWASRPTWCTSYRLLAGGTATGGAAGDAGSADGVKPSLTNHVFMSCRIAIRLSVWWSICDSGGTQGSQQSGDQRASPRPPAPAAPPSSCHCPPAAGQCCQSAQACWSPRP